jgi:hypothetical protein
MKTKKLLSIAIIAALPFAANADYTYVDSDTPANVPANGTVTMADSNGPYQTATIGDADAEHIASTAYVKGAYNETIAAINRLNKRLYNDEAGVNVGMVLSASQVAQAADDLINYGDPYGDYEGNLPSVAGVISAIAHQRVAARDTWGSDHTANVALITVSE